MTPAFEIRHAVQRSRCAVVHLYSQGQPLVGPVAGFNKAAGESVYRPMPFDPSSEGHAGYLCRGRSADRNLSAEVAYPKDTSA